MRRWLVLGAAFAVLGASAGVGCAQTTCDDLGTCAGATSAQDGGPDAPGIDAPLDAPGTLDAPADAIVRPDGGPCDATKRPNEDGCQPIDGSGLFVAPSPKGDDSTGTGTKAKPFASIGGAVAKATGATRIYVCEGTYGALSLDAKASGPITVFGGLSCATWAFTGGKTRLAPAQEGPALRMVGVTAKVELADPAPLPCRETRSVPRPYIPSAELHWLPARPHVRSGWHAGTSRPGRC